jgi:hypothetical protein
MTNVDRMSTVYNDLGRYCWPDLNDMTPQVGDHIAHWWNDLGNGKCGWAKGKISTFNKTKNTFDTLFSDGLVGYNQSLGNDSYGEDKDWVLLMFTSGLN